MKRTVIFCTAVLFSISLLAPGKVLAQCAPPPAGMVAWWPLDETSGPSAFDIAGFPNDGTWNGTPVPVTGKVAGALSFAAAADFVNVPDNPSIDFGTGDFSIDAWIRTTSMGTVAIVDKRELPSGPLGYALNIISGKLNFQLGDGGTFVGNKLSSNPNINDGAWHHVAVTVNGRGSGGGNLYVDGVNVLNFSTDLTGTDDISNAADLRIGQHASFGTSVAFAGAIDEVEIFNRELDSTEVKAIFNADSLGKCKPDTGCVMPPTGMVGWWSGDGTANDVLGTNHGTLQGGATFASGKVNQAFSLNGVNQYVSIGDSPSLRPVSGVTIDGWFKFSSLSDQILVAKTVGTGTSESYLIDYEGGALIGAVGNVSGIAPILSFSWTPTLSTWYHIAYTFDDASDAQKLYIDGYLQASGTTNQSIGYDNHPVTIGAEYNNEVLGFFFSGEIDEVEIFDRALGPTEIYSIWAADSLGKCIPVRNHFKTWRIQPLPFDRLVTVRDQFMQTQDTIILDEIDFLSNPAKKVFQNDTSNIIRPNDHLTWYRAMNLAPLKVFKVNFVNQFESTTVLIDTLKYLLVPTQKDPHPAPDSLLGHYTAYRILYPPISIQIPVTLQDQFDTMPEFTNAVSPVYFLTPAQKNNEPSFGPDTHYVAYPIIPKDNILLTKMTNDQFGTHIMQVDTSEMLLVPSRKVAFNECIAKPGDVNGTGGTPNLPDVIYLVNYVFDKDRLPCLGTDPGTCWPIDPLCRGDVNGSGGSPNLQDVIYLVNFVFDKDRSATGCLGSDPGNCWTPVPTGVCCLP